MYASSTTRVNRRRGNAATVAVPQSMANIAFATRNCGLAPTSRPPNDVLTADACGQFADSITGVGDTPSSSSSASDKLLRTNSTLRVRP